MDCISALERTPVKAFIRVSITLVAASILLMATGVSWLFFYSGDLPGLRAIGNFAPITAGVTTDECVAPQALSVIPYTALGTNHIFGLRERFNLGNGNWSQWQCIANPLKPGYSISVPVRTTSGLPSNTCTVY